ELGRAIGVQGAAQAIGLSVGPSVGGLLIGTLGWQWVFFIAVPFGLLGAVLAWLTLPKTERPAGPARAGVMPSARERFDWWGAGLFAVAIVSALLVLTFGDSWGWRSLPLLAAVLVALAAAMAFVATERHVLYPLVDLALFRQRIFSAGVLSGLLSYAVLFGTLFL